MTRLVLTLAAALALTSHAPAQDRRPVRLIAEAEDFTVTARGWTVTPYRDNYYVGTFAITFLSRMGCLSAPDEMDAGRKAVAEQAVTIPYDDTFELLVRYEQPYDFAAEFTVEVEQGGKVVATFPCGRLHQPKIWAFTAAKPTAMERYSWSGTDNIVWQQPGRVKLAAGLAKLRLIAAEQKDGDKPRANIAKRNIDVVCLTNDKAGIEAQK